MGPHVFQIKLKPMPGQKRRHQKRRNQRLAKKNAPAKKMRWVPYNEYLQSNWWKVKRRQKLKSTASRCERCGGIATQVHHKHYKTLWREKNTDLEAICGSCHEIEHECLSQADRHLRSINNEG